MTIQERKKDHVDLTVNSDVSYEKTTGFEQYDFVHNALPEVNPEDIDLDATFLGRRFSFPLFISSMTGGYTEAGPVNAIIAKCCEKLNLPFGVGSQRAMLEDPGLTDTFSVVRDLAPTAFIAANIGGAQLIGNLKDKKIGMLVKSIEADAIIVHLNPLQELMQPEGDHNFKGIEKGIIHLVANTDCPVIVKETGAGISGEAARRLLSIGVNAIDVAGAGGTSWARVENLRPEKKNPRHQFNNWGIPTVQSLTEVNKLRNEFHYSLIASGGIRSPFDIVKSIALGADFTAVAQPVIKTVVEKGEEGLLQLIEEWKESTKMILTLLGCSHFKELGMQHLRRSYK
ncbi:MAG: type 2 isopentenyl-diphosphate Delta-isomerase [Balneolaceae bacterium]